MAGLLDAKFAALQSTLFRNVVPDATLDAFKRGLVKGRPKLHKGQPACSPATEQPSIEKFSGLAYKVA